MEEITKPTVIVTLKQDEFGALKLREDILFNKRAEITLIQNERDMFWISIAKRYNLDEKKMYSVDKEGNVIEAQPPKDTPKP